MKTKELKRLKDVGPFTMVSRDEKVKVVLDGKVRTFRLVLYGAYNAMGLIGSECNGVAVLDEDNKEVIADELGKIDSGYFGPSKSQVELFELMKVAKQDEFRRIVNGCRRLRMSI